MFVEIKSNIKDYYWTGKIPILLDSIGFFDHQPTVERPEGFPCHHILWVTDGEGKFTFGNETFILKKGQGVFFEARLPHKYTALNGKLATAWITFYGLDGLLQHYGVNKTFIFAVTNIFNDAAHTLYTHCKGNGTVLSRSAAAYSVITEFLTYHFAPDEPLAKRIDRYLENRFADDISLNDVAEEVRLNKYTLCKQYQKMTGQTIMERFKSIRIAKAKKYLICTSHSAESIGKMCGFESPSYFGKVFREITGQTPREYRMKHK